MTEQKVNRAPTIRRIHEDDERVVKRAAESLRARREEGIPEAEVREVAEREGVWAFQIIGILGLSLQGDHFRPKPGAPEPQPERLPPETRPLPTPARGRPVMPPPRAPVMPPPREPVAPPPGPMEPLFPEAVTEARAAVGPSWEERIRKAVEGAEGPEVVITLEQVQGWGWPVKSWQRPAQWSPGYPPGDAARALGWEPSLRDGVGIRLRRK